MNKNESVVSHWSALIDDFETSGQAFFEDVERRVTLREVPDVTFSRVQFRESGVLSAKREYLRVQRDDLLFDVGAAPYGTGFFFSWWMVRSASPYPWAYPLGFLIVWVIGFSFVGGIPGLVLGLILAVVALIGLGKTGLIGPEEHVAAAPLVGGLYRRFVNPSTYHALDTVAMYQESIRRAVNEAVDAALTEQGRQALSPEQKAMAGESTATPDVA